MRRWWLFGALVVLWILAWGRITLANLLSGIVVTAVLLIAFPPRRPTEAIRGNPIGVGRLFVAGTREVVVSNLEMTRQILRRRPELRPGVLAHRLAWPSEVIATVMSSVIALSPGTLTVDVSDDSSVIYVHFFDLRDVPAARASLVRLEQRIHRAVSGPHVLPPDRRQEHT
jgi:multicomponent Na+:H+ antiporter subunit E